MWANTVDFYWTAEAVENAPPQVGYDTRQLRLLFLSTKIATRVSSRGVSSIVN